MTSLARHAAVENVDPGIVEFLNRFDLLQGAQNWAMKPLTGGVASDIWKIETPTNTFVVKKALAKLRVAQQWEAPVARNASEVEWMQEVAKIAPSTVPRILAHDPSLGAFAMTYFDPAENPVWKHELSEGRISAEFAQQMGRGLGKIHSATANSEDIGRRFANADVFHSIRLAPYLEATALVHADLAEPLFSLSRDFYKARIALVHGDISPKNILVGADGPIILDAECASYGDPAFDLAFCLNHLLLKCIWRPQDAARFLASFGALSESYLASVDWEPAASLEARALRLLPVLLLARIDGKSPVEYITAEADKNAVRQFARQAIQTPAASLADLRQTWAKGFNS